MKSVSPKITFSVAVMASMIATTSGASVVATKTQDGAPAIDLGVVSGAQCSALVESPVLDFNPLERGLLANGTVMTAEEVNGLCASKKPVRLMIFTPMTEMTEHGVKNYPVHHKVCVGMVRKIGTDKVLIGGRKVQPADVESACASSSVVEVLK